MLQAPCQVSAFPCKSLIEVRTGRTQTLSTTGKPLLKFYVNFEPQHESKRISKNCRFEISGLNLARSSRISVRAGKEASKKKTEGPKKTREKSQNDDGEKKVERGAVSRTRGKDAIAADSGSKQFGKGFAVLANLRSQLSHSSSATGYSIEVGTLASKKNGSGRVANQGGNVAQMIRDAKSSSLSKIEDISPADSVLKPKLLKSNALDKSIFTNEEQHSPQQGNSTFHIRILDLPNQVTQHQYDSIMQRVPGITKWTFVSDSPGKCSGYWICEAATEESAVLAIKALSQLTVHGKPIKALLEKVQGSQLQNPEDENKKELLEGNIKETIAQKPKGQSANNLVAQDQAKAKKLGKTVERAIVAAINDGGGDSKHEAPGSSGRENPSAGLKSQTAISGSPQLSREIEEVAYGDKAEKQSLRGQDILFAMQRAAMEKAKSKQKNRTTSERVKRAKENALLQETLDWRDVKPIVIRPEWASQIDNLEKRIKDLKNNMLL